MLNMKNFKYENGEEIEFYGSLGVVFLRYEKNTTLDFTTEKPYILTGFTAKMKFSDEIYTGRGETECTAISDLYSTLAIALALKDCGCNISLREVIK